jgi:transcriptional/translational regulatory protein YebC/TACO1
MSIVVPDEDTGDLLPDASQLTSITELVRTQIELEGLVDAFETKTKQAKAALRKVQEDLLPNAILAAGMEQFTMQDGRKVIVSKDLSVSVPKKNLSEITAWLREQGYQDLIKEEITIPLDTVAPDIRERLKKGLTGLGINSDITENVNTASLKAVLRRMLTEGQDVNLKLFGAFPWQKSVIKQ